MDNEVSENTYQVTVPARLRLENIRGSVVISPGNDGEIYVRAEKQAEGKHAQDTQVVMEQTSDGQVIVKTRCFQEIMSLFHSHPCRVDYTVRLPRQSEAEVRVVSSSLSITGLEGKFRFDSVSGEVHLENLTGPVKLATVSGSVSGSGVSGALEVNTVSGDVRLEASNIPSLHAETVSGTLHFATSLGEGPYHANSVSGDLRLSLPLNTRCTVETNSLSGRADVELPMTSKQRSHGRMRADVNGGGTLVQLKSISGNLVIHSDGTQSAEATPQPKAKINTKEVLEKINQGEMTVDEGLAILNRA